VSIKLTLAIIWINIISILPKSQSLVWITIRVARSGWIISINTRSKKYRIYIIIYSSV